MLYCSNNHCVIIYQRPTQSEIKLIHIFYFKHCYVHARITKAIQDVVGRKVELDMKRMAAIIHREILDAMDKVLYKENIAGFLKIIMMSFLIT